MLIAVLRGMLAWDPRRSRHRLLISVLFQVVMILFWVSFVVLTGG